MDKPLLAARYRGLECCAFCKQPRMLGLRCCRISWHMESSQPRGLTVHDLDSQAAAAILRVHAHVDALCAQAREEIRKQAIHARRGIGQRVRWAKWERAREVRPVSFPE